MSDEGNALADKVSEFIRRHPPEEMGRNLAEICCDSPIKKCYEERKRTEGDDQ